MAILIKKKFDICISVLNTQVQLKKKFPFFKDEKYCLRQNLKIMYAKEKIILHSLKELKTLCKT